MTWDEIDTIFPSSYSGNAQISDLRLLLSKLITSEYLGKIDFYEVQNLSERDALPAKHSDICKVFDTGAGETITYIYKGSENQWVVLVENTGTGGLPGTTNPQRTENFTISTLNQQDQSVTLLNTPRTSEHFMVFLNGMYLMLGGEYDYSLVSNTIVFTGTQITADDNLAVKYSY